MAMIRTPGAVAAAALLVSIVLATGSTPAMATVGPVASKAFTTAQAVTGDDATLTGLTCVSKSRCLTAGFYIARAEGSIFGLSEVFNGHSWGTLTVSGLATKADVTDALEVSCGAPTNCMIVGEHYNNPKLPVQFADTLRTVWTPVKWTNPAGAKWSVLDDVKCVGASFCMAIGTFSKTSGGGRALAEQWNGHSWRRLATPNPAGAHLSDLSALYCQSATDCQAVGVGRNSAGHLFSFGEHWDGTGWTLGKIPNVHGRNNVLNDVACFASGDCIAVGNTSTSASQRPLVISLHAGVWNIARTPSLPRSAALNGVSCPTSTFCVAAGFAGRDPLAEIWNGVKWALFTVAHTPTRALRHNDSLQHVICVSITHCEAAGFTYNAARPRIGNHTLIEEWNGKGWRIQASVNP
jgi:hypothetical protein